MVYWCMAIIILAVYEILLTLAVSLEHCDIVGLTISIRLAGFIKSHFDVVIPVQASCQCKF